MNDVKRQKKNGISGRSTIEEINKRNAIIDQILKNLLNDNQNEISITKKQLFKIIEEKLRSNHVQIPEDRTLDNYIKSKEYKYSKREGKFYLQSEIFHNLELIQGILRDNIQQINILLSNHEFVLYPQKLDSKKKPSQKYYQSIQAALSNCKKNHIVTFHLKIILKNIGFENTLAKLLLEAIHVDDYYYTTPHLKCVELHFSKRLLSNIMKLLQAINEDVYIIYEPVFEVNTQTDTLTDDTTATFQTETTD